MHPLETQIFVAGDPLLVERGREQLGWLRQRRPPGLAVDEVADDLLERGARGVLVQLDGIIRVGGTSPTDDGWLTVVPHPRGHFATAVLRLHDAAVVTMANPRAGSPTEGAVAGVSVVSDRAWEAELLATTALSAGRSGGAESAVEFLSATGLPALVLDEWDDAVPLGTWTTLSATGAAQPSLVSSR